MDLYESLGQNTCISAFVLDLDEVWIVIEHKGVVPAPVHDLLALPQLVLGPAGHLVIGDLQLCGGGDLGGLGALGQAAAPTAGVVRYVKQEVGHADDGESPIQLILIPDVPLWLHDIVRAVEVH